MVASNSKKVVFSLRGMGKLEWAQRIPAKMGREHGIFFWEQLREQDATRCSLAFINGFHGEMQQKGDKVRFECTYRRYFYWFELLKNGKDCLERMALNEWTPSFMHMLGSWLTTWPDATSEIGTSIWGGRWGGGGTR